VSIHDIYFAEAILDLEQEFGASTTDWLRRTALLLFTPDAVVSRQVAAGVRLLGEAGFRPVAATLVRIDRLSCREIWRRELSPPDPQTLDRLAVCDLLFPYTDSVAVLLRDEHAEPELSATTRLSRLKGSGEPALREPGTLRRRLHSPNNVFRLVHASDGPDELVRELGILFDKRRRLALLRDARTGRTPALDRLAAAAIGPVGERSLDIGPSLRRLAPLLDGHPHRGFREVLAALDDVRPVPDTWDLIAVGARSLAGGAS
jgi:nucleoside diphosphate kinase